MHEGVFGDELEEEGGQSQEENLDLVIRVVLAHQEQYNREDDKELPCVGPLLAMVYLLPVGQSSALTLVSCQPKRGSPQVVEH